MACEAHTVVFSQWLSKCITDTSHLSPLRYISGDKPSRPPPATWIHESHSRPARTPLRNFDNGQRQEMSLCHKSRKWQQQCYPANTTRRYYKQCLRDRTTIPQASKLTSSSVQTHHSPSTRHLEQSRCLRYHRCRCQFYRICVRHPPAWCQTCFLPRLCRTVFSHQCLKALERSFQAAKRFIRILPTLANKGTRLFSTARAVLR